MPSFKIDMHVHTRPASPCSHMTPEEMTAAYKAAGFDGFVLCNHYLFKNEMDPRLVAPDATEEEHIEFYLENYHRAKRAAQAHGLYAGLGLEVRLLGRWEDYLIYGADEDWVRKNQKLYAMSQKELFELCGGDGLLLFQAHPTRTFMGARMACMRYLHGLEAVNGNVEIGGDNAAAYAIARHQGLLCSAGSDSHAPGEIVSRDAGMIFPRCPSSGADLADMLKSGKGELIFHGQTFETDLHFRGN